jgi:serine phosphatase RsbU (regulator of sigma subunit)
VGGDWYDCIRVDDALVALVMGDVMGKGLRAATTMGQIRTSLRPLATRDLSPAQALDRLDELSPSLGNDDIATAVYVLLDLERGRATVARAGHPPPILVTPDGRASLVTEGGSPPLGCGISGRVDASVEVPEGSLLVLYTDGMVETRSAGLDDLDRFVDSVGHEAARRPGDLEGLATTLLAAATTRQHDDDSALLIARMPSVTATSRDGVIRGQTTGETFS